jgi:hypothetical protein
VEDQAILGPAPWAIRYGEFKNVVAGSRRLRRFSVSLKTRVEAG